MTSVPDRLMAAPHWNTTASVRIPPGDLAALGPGVWLMSRLGGRAMGGGHIRLLQTLGRHRLVLRAYLRFGFGLVVRGRLPRPAMELVTLRTAWNAGCRYEFFHHMYLARTAGISWETIERVGRGPSGDGWSERARTLLIAVDELCAARTLSEDTWTRLRTFLDDRQLTALCLLTGNYGMLAMTLNTFDP